MNQKLVRSSSALVLSIASLVGSVSPAHATASTITNGKIIYASNASGGTSEINARSQDGFNFENLSNNAATDLATSISASGTKLVFISDRGTTSDIYTMNADGSGITRITNDAAIEQDPKLSPDGTKITYTKFMTGISKYHTFVMNADGSGSATEIDSSNTTTDYKVQDWTPAGLIVYRRADTTDAANDGIYTMTNAGASQTKIAGTLGTDLYAAVSPDGTKLLVYGNVSGGSGAGMYTNTMTGGTRAFLVSSTNTPNPPAWSPDGSKIIYTSFASGYYKLFVANADGTNAARLTTEATLNESYPIWQKVAFSSSTTSGNQTTITVANGDTLPTQGYNVLNNQTLVVNGTLGSVGVNPGAILKGTGTVGTLSLLGGTVAPGQSPGVLNTGNFTAAGGTLEEELGGTTAGSYDQLNVTGTVTLGSTTTLTTTLYNSFAPAIGDTFTIINNDGADAVSGTFTGMAEGATFTVGSSVFKISYVGGTGNDVVLTAMDPSTPVTVPTAPDTGFKLLAANPVTTLAFTLFAALGSIALIRRHRLLANNR